MSNNEMKVEVESNIVAQRRIGVFVIRARLLKESPDLFRSVLKDMIVVDAFVSWDSDNIVYTAYSERFEHVPRFHRPYLYSWGTGDTGNDINFWKNDDYLDALYNQ